MPKPPNSVSLKRLLEAQQGFLTAWTQSPVDRERMFHGLQELSDLCAQDGSHETARFLSGLIERSVWRPGTGNQCPKGVTSLEERLLKALREGPKDKFELIEEIYGMVSSRERCESRLKTLISRLRRKNGDIIRFENGRYTLAPA